MGIENFITDALFKPSDYIAYHVGRELAELHPGKAIIEGETGWFDLEGFVRAGKCSIVHETALFNHVRTDWMGPQEQPRKWLQNSFVNVLWNGHLLDVVLVTYSRSCYPSRYQWILADDLQLAEKFFSAVCEWSSEVHGEVLVFQDGEWMKNKELYDSIKSASFDDLILCDGLKAQVREEFAQFFSSREVYDRYRIPWKRGALFIGPPGNGKTHTLKALINELDQPCLYVKGFKGECSTEQENMNLVFARARMTTPCIVVLEDLDSMIDDQSRSFLLNELDGFEVNAGVAVLATTNHPEKLDAAIMDRPSRFDRKYYFELPGEKERQHYIEYWNGELESELRLSEAAIANLGQRTEGFSFAYLKELFLSSIMQWISQERGVPMDEVVLSQADLLRSQAKITDGSPPEQKRFSLESFLKGKLR